MANPKATKFLVRNIANNCRSPQVDVEPKTKPKALAGVQEYLDSLGRLLETLKEDAKQSGKVDLEASKKRLIELSADKVRLSSW